MERPTGLRALDLETTARSTDVRCELAQASFNSAHRGKVAYQVLTFLLAVVLALAVAYTFIAFDDDQQARGWIGLITAVGSLLTTGVFAVLAKNARDDENAMWGRVEQYCGGDLPPADASREMELGAR